MLRKGIALLLLSTFIMSVTIPTIVSLLDNNSDISIFNNINEEENKEKETSKDAETKIIEIQGSDISLYGLELSDSTRFYLKNYAKPYLNLRLPPPEYHFL